MVYAGVVLATFFVGILAFVVLVVALPVDYFSEGHPRWTDQHPAVRWGAIIGKNLLGLAIVALGVLLSVPGIPGQGILTILIGLTLLDFPGKQRLVNRFVRRPWVVRSLNRIRGWFGRRPLAV